MAVDNFIPEIWSKLILASLQKQLIYGSPAVVNDDYDGEIAGPGDAVHITQFGDPQVSDYAIGQGIEYDPLIDAGLTLYIDQSKYFAFSIDDVDKRQAAGEMQPYLEGRAAYRMADAADQFIASHYVYIDEANVLGSTSDPVTPQPYGGSTTHPADAYVMVTEPLKVIMDQNNVPEDGRYLVAPPWFVSLLSQVEAFVKMTDSTGNINPVMAKGFVGSISGFNVFKSNNNPQPVAGPAGTAVNAIQAGHPMAITYGEQIAETEALRLQDTIGDGIRGLHCYGAEMIRPDCAAVAYTLRPEHI